RDRRGIQAADSWPRDCPPTALKCASGRAQASPYRQICSRSCSQASSCPWPCGSSDDCEQPAPAYRYRPAPELPGALAFKDREENDLCLAHDILERHHSDLAEPAVGRIVAIVAHHEIVVGRHRIDLGIVGKAIVNQIECVIAHAVWKCFLPAFDRRIARAFFR